jgi:hypothetical protein
MSGPLKHNPAQILVALLRALTPGTGTGTSPESPWAMFDSFEPSSPDNCITVYDTTGRMQGRIQSTGEVQGFQGIQLRIRATDSSLGYAKAQELQTLLDEEVSYNEVTVEDSTSGSTATYVVYAVTRTTDIIPLGTEPGTSRYLYTINAVMSLRTVS